MDGDEPVDVATQREERTIRSEVSGLSNVWLFIQTFFFSNGKLAIQRYIEKAFSNDIK